MLRGGGLPIRARDRDRELHIPTRDEVLKRIQFRVPPLLREEDLLLDGECVQIMLDGDQDRTIKNILVVPHRDSGHDRDYDSHDEEFDERGTPQISLPGKQTAVRLLPVDCQTNHATAINYRPDR